VSNPIWITENRVTPTGKLEGHRMDYSYYKQKRYLVKYSQNMLDFVNERLDSKLLDRLGYHKEIQCHTSRCDLRTSTTTHTT
jgi:hypothetical protein